MVINRILQTAQVPVFTGIIACLFLLNLMSHLVWVEYRKSVEKTSYGAHCWKLNYQFDTYSGPKNFQAEVISSIMTDDTSIKKSCAQTLVDGADVSIFDINGALLYNPLFMGNKDLGFFKGTEDYFLWFGKGNKLPIKSAFTQVKMLSENLYECEDLK